MNRAPGRAWRTALVSILALVLLLWAAWHYQDPLARWLGEWLIVEDPLRRSDVVVALAGSGWLRVPEAARLVREGHGDRLLITLAKASPRWEEFASRYGLDCSDETLALRIAADADLPAERVALLRGSTSTWTDAELVRGAWRRRPFRSAILVTDPYHLRRARRCFERVFGNTGVRFRMHASFDPADSDRIFSDRQDVLQYIVTEYLRTAYYYVAH